MNIRKKNKSYEDKTDYKILACARELFVENGYSGTSMGKIALKADINHSLIFHHFGNKQKLWQAVKESIIAEGKRIYDHVPETSLPLQYFLRSLIQRTTRFYRENPDIVKMINWQRVDAAAQDLSELSMSSESELWINACKHYQSNGEISKSHKIEHVVSLILSLINSLAMNPNQFAHDEKAKTEYQEFCIDMLIKSFQN